MASLPYVNRTAITKNFMDSKVLRDVDFFDQLEMPFLGGVTSDNHKTSKNKVSVVVVWDWEGNCLCNSLY